MVPGEVGRRIASALGISGTMLAFKGRPLGSPKGPVKGSAEQIKTS